MFRSVNYNFSVTKRTGRLLLCDSNEEELEEIPDGSCDVHFSELHSGLALSLSLATCSVGGNAINRWAPFQDLWKASKKMSKCLCDRKNNHYE